jgi:hypothetical protein
MALGADPSYLFARLLHQACNEGLDPESIRRCLRAERERRDARARSEATQCGGGRTTEDRMRPNMPGPDVGQAASRPGSAGMTEPPDISEDALPACPSGVEGALPPGPSDIEGALPPCTSDVEGALPPCTSDVEGALPPCTSDVEGALPPCTSDVEGALPPRTSAGGDALPSCPSEADPTLSTPAYTASRRRRRMRSGARADARPHSAEAEGRHPCAEESRPRSRSARGTRPGAVRRTTGKDDARRPEGTRPGGGATEEEG